jgi:8-oxo-dGTP diphosphatase
MTTEPDTRVACAGAVVRDRGGRILLIKRGTDPGRGLWSVPGGRCEPGETTEQACVRETAEETGLTVVIDRWLGRVERPGTGVTYVIDDFLCAPVDASDGDADEPVARDPIAGDDAADARWVTQAQLMELALVPGLIDALSEWSIL